MSILKTHLVLKRLTLRYYVFMSYFGECKLSIALKSHPFKDMCLYELFFICCEVKNSA
jgi:hypothetical protein